jgi:hypothetical protein
VSTQSISYFRVLFPLPITITYTYRCRYNSASFTPTNDESDEEELVFCAKCVSVSVARFVRNMLVLEYWPWALGGGWLLASYIHKCTNKKVNEKLFIVCSKTSSFPFSSFSENIISVIFNLYAVVCITVHLAVSAAISLAFNSLLSFDIAIMHCITNIALQ